MHVSHQQVEGQRAFIFPADGIECGNGALRPLHQPRHSRRQVAGTWTFHGAVAVFLEDGEGGAEVVHRLGPEGPALPEPQRDLN